MEIKDTLSLGKIIDSEEMGDCPMPKTKFPEKTPIAMAYVPYQMWENPYDAETGMARGTVFPSLDLPFIGEEAVKNANVK